MRKFIIITLILSLVLVGCTAPDSGKNTTNTPDLYQSTPYEDWSSQTDPIDLLEDENSGPVTSDPTEATPTVPDPSENSTDETNAPQQATEIPTTPTTPPEETKPAPTTPPETMPTQPSETQPPETTIEETVPPTTEPEVTEPQIDQNSYKFKRQVAQYAAQYINQYRAAAGVGPCEVLPGMTLVAEYRADQLTYNYAHDTADKREALAHYQYGKWVDATIAGLDASKSYYDAEAPLAGMTQKEVADAIHIDDRTVLNIENHKGSPKIEILFPLVRLLHIDANEIFYPGTCSGASEIRDLLLLAESCTDAEAAVLIPVIQSVLAVLRSDSRIAIK